MSATLAKVIEMHSTPDLDLWDAFWTLYPRREAKKDAARAWSRMSIGEQTDAVMAMYQWRKIWAAQGRTTDKIRLPATWLNGEQWTDDIPAEFVDKKHSSHVAAALPELPPRGEIPDYIKKQIAELKARK